MHSIYLSVTQMLHWLCVGNCEKERQKSFPDIRQHLDLASCPWSRYQNKKLTREKKIQDFSSKKMLFTARCKDIMNIVCY